MTTRLVAQLTEHGEALTERVADVADGLRVVVGNLTPGQGHVLVPFEGEVDQLVEVALRLARTGHTVHHVARLGESYFPHLEGPTSQLTLVNAYLGLIEGARVSACRA